MSLWQKAYETYEAHAHLAGIKEPEKQPLVPVGHIIQKAQIELTLHSDGSFHDARKIEPTDCKTVIPATERSASRTSGAEPLPHPLCEQLVFLINGSPKYEKYLEQLKEWADSPYSTPKLKAILKYVRDGTILQDLAREKLVVLNPDGTLGKGKIFTTEYEKCLVRWRVLNSESRSAVWEDLELFKAYQKYQQSKQTPTGLCMISGQYDSITKYHPKGVLPSEYGAKLISANDKHGFTYRGRFTEAEQAVSVGFQASQKVHNALQWLLATQGVPKGSRRFLCWNPRGKPVPKVFDPFAEADGMPDPLQPSDYKQRLADTLRGWKQDLPDEEDVVLASFEAVTTGRISVTYYSEMKAWDFHRRLERWFTTVAFPDSKGNILCPTLENIINSAYGTEQKQILKVNDNLSQDHLQGLLCCMTEGRPISASLVKALCIRASQPLCYKEEKNLELVRHCACALLRKYLNDQSQEEVWTMVLDEKNTDRSYLFGRMLALMEYIERSTYDRNEKRVPNALRMQTIFCERPFYAVKVLTERLNPYYRKLSLKTQTWYDKQIGDIYTLFRLEDMDVMNRPLDNSYLLGYHLQRNFLYTKKDNNDMTEDN